MTFATIFNEVKQWMEETGTELTPAQQKLLVLMIGRITEADQNETKVKIQTALNTLEAKRA